MTRISRSPSLSKSPNAQPRLQCAAEMPGPASSIKFLKVAVAEIAKDDARRLVRIVGKLLFDLRIHAAGDQKMSGQPSLSRSTMPAPQPDEARLHAEPGSCGHVVEIALAIVAIEDVGVFGEVGLEEIEMAIEIDSRRRRRPSRPAPSRLR